jgi:hypothetical protein
LQKRSKTIQAVSDFLPRSESSTSAVFGYSWLKGDV